MTTDKEALCLYRCWTEKINGKPQQMQSCYSHNGGGVGLSAALDKKEVKEGNLIKGFLGGKKYQVIKCKYPKCI